MIVIKAGGKNLMQKLNVKDKLAIFLHTLKEVFFSSIALAVIIVIVCGFVAPLKDTSDYIKLIAGYLGVVFGQALFLVGIDISILPIGKLVGGSLIKLKRPAFIILFGVFFGLIATVAEPALIVLAKQTNMIMPIIDETAFIWVMGGGIGILVGFSLFRIIKDLNIKIVFATLYIITFALIFFVPKEFVGLAFDGSGATTGDISVPFILALGLGVSVTMSRHKSNDDSFGIIGLASVGPILSLAVYGLILRARYGVLPAEQLYDPGTIGQLGEIVINNLFGVVMALLPIIVVYLPFQFFLIKQPKKEVTKILLGTIIVFFGLLIFLSGIDYGFAFAGKYIGEIFLDPSRPGWFKWLLLAVGFILGAAITLSEPAVTVLGEQLEEITNGHIKKNAIRITLAIGIGFAALLAMIKIITRIDILWFLVPLYVISLVMMLFTPRLFVGLAFDSGGVSGGALTSAFLTPLTLGMAQAVQEGSILVNGFGMIAFISVTPLIAVQLLGIVYDINIRKANKYLNDAEMVDREKLALLAEEVEHSHSHETEAQTADDNTADDNIAEDKIDIEDNISDKGMEE